MLNKIKEYLKINKIISIGDYKKYGCVNCNIINVPELNIEDNLSYKKITCQKCQTSFYIVPDSLITPKNLVRQHPNKNEGKLFELDDKRPDNRNEDYCIYINGNNEELLFKVYSKNAAERIVNMFNNCKDNNIFTASAIYDEKDPLNVYVKINYLNTYKALVLKNEIVKNKDKINKNIIEESINLELNFKNKWEKCCLFRKVFELSNVEYIQSHINKCKNSSDIYNISSMKQNRPNIIEIFETFGMYTQVNKELENNNIDLAVKCILHYTSNIETNYIKQKTLENKEYINNIRKSLQKDLLNLLNTHYKYENSELRPLKMNYENNLDIKNINITDYLDKIEFKTTYEIVIKPLLDSLIDKEIIRNLTVYANEIPKALTDNQKKNNYLMTYLLYGFKTQIEVEFEKNDYKDAYFAIEYLLERLNSPLYKIYINNIENQKMKMDINILKTQLQIMHNTFTKKSQEKKETKTNNKKRKLSLLNK